MKHILLRYQRGVVGAVAAVLLAVTSVVGVAQILDQNEATSEQKAAQNETQFWRVVAGEAGDTSPTVDVLLARDLRSLSASDVEQFRGDSNRYGGITDAIGYDPFDETGLNCFECGPLDPYTKRNLTLIRQGNIDQVVAALEVEGPDEGLTLTPGGVSFLSYFAALWIVGGPFTLLAAHWLAKFTNERYAALRRFGDLFIEDDGPSREMVLYAPTFWGPYEIYRRSTKQRFQDRVRDTFPLQMEELDRFDRALERAPVDPDTWTLLQSRRNEVMRELESQTRSGEGTDDSVNALMSQIATVQEYLEARTEAKKELER
jgi:hypothetical protein